MKLREDLLAIERTLWSGGPEEYRQHLDEDCLLAFTRMAGVSSRDDVANTAANAPRWRELDIEFEGLVTSLVGHCARLARKSRKPSR